MRQQSAALANNIWAPASKLGHHAFVASDAWKRFSATIYQLPNATEQQRQFRKQIDDVISRGAQARLHLYTDSGSTLPVPFLVLLIFWLAVIFASYSILGAINPTVMVFVALFALSAAGALFLITVKRQRVFFAVSWRFLIAVEVAVSRNHRRAPARTANAQ